MQQLQAILAFIGLALLVVGTVQFLRARTRVNPLTLPTLTPDQLRAVRQAVLFGHQLEDAALVPAASFVARQTLNNVSMLAMYQPWLLAAVAALLGAALVPQGLIAAVPALLALALYLWSSSVNAKGVRSARTWLAAHPDKRGR